MHTSQLDYRHLPIDLQAHFARQIIGSSNVESSVATDEDRTYFVDNIAEWLSDLRSGSSSTACAREVFYQGGRHLSAMSVPSEPTVSPRGVANQVFTSTVFGFEPWEWPLNLLIVPSAVSRCANPLVSIRWAPDDDMWSQLTSSVRRWANLPDDWDGDDGVAPPSRSVDAAIEFLGRLRQLEMPIPKGFVSGDGEIGFRWESAGGFASAAFLPDGHIVAFSSFHGEQPIKIDALYDKYCPMGSFFKSISKI